MPFYTKFGVDLLEVDVTNCMKLSRFFSAAFPTSSLDKNGGFLAAFFLPPLFWPSLLELF